MRGQNDSYWLGGWVQRRAWTVGPWLLGGVLWLYGWLVGLEMDLRGDVTPATQRPSRNQVVLFRLFILFRFCLSCKLPLSISLSLSLCLSVCLSLHPATLPWFDNPPSLLVLHHHHERQQRMSPNLTLHAAETSSARRQVSSTLHVASPSSLDSLYVARSKE